MARAAYHEAGSISPKLRRGQRMKTVIATIVLTTTFWIGIASANDAKDRPSGVEGKNWISISDRFGFVIDEKGARPSANSSRQVLIAPPEAVSAELMPPAKGYFVVKTATGWRRVAMAE
jgi:hypothetical protein